MGQPLTAAVRYLSGEREPVRVATTANITLQGLLIVDDVDTEVGDRILVKDQTDPKQNGIYLASEGVWFRAPDASYTRSINQGVTVQVQEGSTNHDRTYRFDTQNPVVGQDPIVVSYYLSANLTEDIQEIVDSAAEDAAALALAGAAEAIQPLVDEAEDYRDQAAGYADFVRNNWVIAARFMGTASEDDFPLLIDPGSENNMFVSVGSTIQPPGGDNPPWLLVYEGSDPFIRINAPTDTEVVVRVSNATPAGTPSDGGVTTPKLGSESVTTEKLAGSSVTTAKLANKATTFEKMQDLSTLRLMGRKTAGSGSPEEVSPEDLLAFLPVGSAVGFGSAVYTATEALSSVIPKDDTVPVVTEGTEILSVLITPKSSANKLRARFSGMISATAAPADVVFAIFLGDVCVFARPTTSQGSQATLSGEILISPNTTSEVRVSVRVGPGSSGPSIYFNGTNTRLMGGASVATLTVDEIKG